MDSRKILSLIAYWYINFTKKTLRVKDVELVPKLEEQSVYALWHGEQILPLCLNSGLNIAAMCSMSKDGEIQAGVLKRFGFIAVRGSSSKRAERALIETIRYARKGHCIAFTVDGPKGPIYKVKPGLLMVSQKVGIRLIPISAMAKHSLVFNKAWDKFKVPLPFSKTVVAYGNPIRINKDDILEEKAQIVEQELNKLREFTNKYCWSKDINEYLSHHPKPKFIIKCKDNIEKCVNKINELKQKYPSSQITLVIGRHCEEHSDEAILQDICHSRNSQSGISLSVCHPEQSEGSLRSYVVSQPSALSSQPILSSRTEPSSSLSSRTEQSECESCCACSVVNIKDITIINKITFNLRKEQFDVALGTTFFENLILNPTFKQSL